MDKAEVKTKIREIIFSPDFLQNNPADVADDYLLISNGLLDSINVLRVVDKLEKVFSIECQAHEVDKDNLDSIDRMVNFVLKKIKA